MATHLWSPTTLVPSMILSPKPNLSFDRTRSKLRWNQEDQEELPSGLLSVGMSRMEQFLWTKRRWTDKLAKNIDLALVKTTTDFGSYLSPLKKNNWLYNLPSGPDNSPSGPAWMKALSEKIPILKLSEQRRIFFSVQALRVNRIKDKLLKISAIFDLKIPEEKKSFDTNFEWPSIATLPKR